MSFDDGRVLAMGVATVAVAIGAVVGSGRAGSPAIKDDPLLVEGDPRPGTFRTGPDTIVRRDGYIVRGKKGDPAWLDTTDGLVPVRVTSVSEDGRKVWTRVTATVAERGRGETIATSWFNVYPEAAVFTLSNGQIRIERYTWHPTAVWGPVSADKAMITNDVVLGRRQPLPWPG